MFVQLFIHGITNEQADKSDWRANERANEQRASNTFRRWKETKEARKEKGENVSNGFDKFSEKLSGWITSSKGFQANPVEHRSFRRSSRRKDNF